MLHSIIPEQLSPRRRAVLGYAIAVLLVAAGAGLRALLAANITPIYPTFFLAVGLTAVICGFGPAIAATVLSVISAIHFFSERVNAMDVRDFHVRTVVFVAIGVAFSAVAEFVHRARARAARAERELDAAEWREHLYDLTPSIIFEADAEGSTIFVSQRWTECFGCPATEALGDGWARFVHPDDVEASSKKWRAAVCDRVKIEVEHRMLAADGGWRWFLVRARPVRSNGGAVHWVGSVTDIDDLLKAQSVLREADHRKNEFLATLAHELRNPLACIHNAIGALRLAAAQDKPANVTPTLEIAARQVLHLNRLVDELLDISRISHDKIALRSESLDLLDVLHDALETCRPQMESKGHRLETRFPAQALRIVGDRLRLGQVFVNLLQNAAKYTPEHGQIRVEAARVDGDAIVTVRDDGVGIPREMLGRIFDLFTQAKFYPPFADNGHAEGGLSAGGLGVGLALARKLVEMHKGDIAAHSDGADKGSQFTVRLPLDMSEAPRALSIVNSADFAAPALGARPSSQMS